MRPNYKISDSPLIDPVIGGDFGVPIPAQDSCLDDSYFGE
jgi:hypothetical protein